MKRERRAFLIILLVPCFLAFSPAEETHSSALIDFLAKSLNFLLLFGGLAFLLAKPLRAFLEARASGIRRVIEEARKSREEAEQKLEVIKRKLQKLEEEVAGIKSKGKAEGEQEKERILEKARREAEKIKAFTRQEIEHQVQASIHELKEYAAELATALAKERIAKRLTTDLHSKFIDDSIQRIGKLHEESDSG